MHRWYHCKKKWPIQKSLIVFFIIYWHMYAGSLTSLSFQNIVNVSCISIEFLYYKFGKLKKGIYFCNHSVL